MNHSVEVKQPRIIESQRQHSEKMQELWQELDPLTRAHCLRVEALVGQLAIFAGFDTQFIKKAQGAAYIHDIGKADPKVRKRLLLPREETTEDDLACIRNHTIFGAQRALNARLPKELANIILHHHEDNNGIGYPNGWTREQTANNLGEDAARIIDLLRIADSFDSMASGHYALGNRTLRRAAEEIRLQMQEGKYNKDLLPAFNELVTKLENKDVHNSSLA